MAPTGPQIYQCNGGKRDLEDLRKPYKDWTLQDLSILQ